MTSEAVSPLPRRMIEDMEIRRFGGKTKQRLHPAGPRVRGVLRALARPGRARGPATLPAPYGLARRELRADEFGCDGTAVLLPHEAGAGFGDRMARIPSPERLPVVLSTEEAALLLAHAPNLKYRAALSVAYGCGLRVW